MYTYVHIYTYLWQANLLTTLLLWKALSVMSCWPSKVRIYIQRYMFIHIHTYVYVYIHTEEQELARRCKVALYIENFYKNQTSGISEKETCRSLGIPSVKKMRSLLEKGVHTYTYMYVCISQYWYLYVYIQAKKLKSSWFSTTWSWSFISLSTIDSGEHVYTYAWLYT